MLYTYIRYNVRDMGHILFVEVKNALFLLSWDRKNNLSDELICLLYIHFSRFNNQ